MNTTIAASSIIEVTSGSLVVLAPDTGLALGPPVRIDTERCIVGRGERCHVVLNDARVSTSHCALVATDKGVVLEDLDSRNGTFVNQVRLHKNSPVYLDTDARIRCGQTWLAFQCAGRTQVAVSGADSFGPLVGSSLAIRRVYTQLERAAGHELSVLITGETGTGKELVAQAIHRASQRRAGPFVTVDCTTIPASLAESKLFGHERGSFTGAVARQMSPFVEAQGGTIFFDELGELPAEIQPKLLRALEARQIQSVGSNRYQPIDVRVIAATRRNMHVEMNAKRFREDLYYRFAHVLVEVPSLRERVEDIAFLVAHFLTELGDPIAIHRIAPASMDRLTRHDWPGNVRELRNVVLAAHAQSGDGALDFTELLSARGQRIDFGSRVSSLGSFPILKREMLDALERDYFAKLHVATGGNLSEMARRSGLSRPTVREYLQRHGLRVPD